MAKKAKSKSGGGGSWKPGWITGLIVILAAAGLASLGFMTKPPSAEEVAEQKAEEAIKEATEKPRIPMKELERRLESQATQLEAVASRGDSGVFGKIKAMAAHARKALDAAKAAKSPAERRAALEAGLNAKEDWLKDLNEDTARLHAEQEEHDKENPPLDTQGVASLTTEAFSDFIAANHHSMVEFFAPWCPHCKKFAPEYKELADKFQGRAAFAVVDGTKETQLTRVYRIEHYPTMKWFVHGRAFEYDGPLKAEKVSEWVENRLTPSYMDVDARSDLEEALKVVDGNGKVWLVGGEGDKGEPLFKAFAVASEHFRGKLLFGWAPSNEPGIRLYRGSATDVETCGATGLDCSDAENLIAWLEDKLTEDKSLDD